MVLMLKSYITILILQSFNWFLKKEFYSLLGNFDTKYKCSADYDIYYKLFIKKKLIGSSTEKSNNWNSIFWGFSSKFGF